MKTRCPETEAVLTIYILAIIKVVLVYIFRSVLNIQHRTQVP